MSALAFFFFLSFCSQLRVDRIERYAMVQENKLPDLAQEQESLTLEHLPSAALPIGKAAPLPPVAEIAQRPTPKRMQSRDGHELGTGGVLKHHSEDAGYKGHITGTEPKVWPGVITSNIRRQSSMVDVEAALKVIADKEKEKI